MHGTDDKATVCHGSEFFYEHAGSKDKTLKLYEGHYHDLLADIGKEDVHRRHHDVDRQARAGVRDRTAARPLPGRMSTSSGRGRKYRPLHCLVVRRSTPFSARG